MRIEMHRDGLRYVTVTMCVPLMKVGCIRDEGARCEEEGCEITCRTCFQIWLLTS